MVVCLKLNNSSCTNDLWWTSFCGATFMIETDAFQIVPLFWDELEQLLGPIFQPIVGPLFDILRVDANRLVLLTTIVSMCIFFVVIAYVVYDLPISFRWLSTGSASLNAATRSNTGYSTPGKTPTRYSAKAKSAERTETKKVSTAEVIGDVTVESELVKVRDAAELTVTVTNKSEHPIEMVVVDLHLPEGIDIMTGSFRIQRIGTIPSGDSTAAKFMIQNNYGSYAKISGMVEFMSSSYEITKVDIPAPAIN